MIMIQGELFKQIQSVDYFDTHNANFNNLKTNKIVTHNSDWSTSQALSSDNNANVFYKNKNIIWFAQNVDVYHPRIKSIPIGLENSEWFKEIDKPYKISKIKNNQKQILSVAKFNPDTHPSRKKILEYFQNTNWCISESIRNGYNFDIYLDQLSKSLTCICPRGNGIDTHRIWEALYVNTIPIVEDCINIRFYKELPIIIVDSFLNVTPDFILQKVEELNHKMLNFNLLDFNHWSEYIINYENNR